MRFLIQEIRKKLKYVIICGLHRAWRTYTYWRAYKLVRSWFLVGTPVTYVKRTNHIQFPPAWPFKSLSYGNTRDVHIPMSAAKVHVGLVQKWKTVNKPGCQSRVHKWSSGVSVPCSPSHDNRVTHADGRLHAEICKAPNNVSMEHCTMSGIKGNGCVPVRIHWCVSVNREEGVRRYPPICEL